MAQAGASRRNWTLKYRLFAGLLAVLTCWPVHADWVLDNDASRISYVTTKANVAAEVNHFRKLSGDIDADGSATLTIDLDSVDTAVEIRDTRMREILFETATFPTAQVSATIDMDEIATAASGSAAVIIAEAIVNLRGMDVSVTFEATVAKLDSDNLLVTSTKPVIVSASQFGLLEGIEKLRTIAGLPSISPAVPVTFVLKWSRK